MFPGLVKHHGSNCLLQVLKLPWENLTEVTSSLQAAPHSDHWLPELAVLTPKHPPLPASQLEYSLFTMGPPNLCPHPHPHPLPLPLTPSLEVFPAWTLEVSRLEGSPKGL